mgnify:CR=1 FL=1|jgi:hypothetical protein
MQICIKVSKAELEEAEMTESELKGYVLDTLEDCPGFDVVVELED